MALSLLATVLVMSYQILSNVLETERVVAKLSTPEKIGQGILTLVRKDLMGAVYQNMGERVFQVIDGGEGNWARDELQFFTTVATINPDNLAGNQTDVEEALYDVPEESTNVTAVHWFLQESNARTETQLFTLFRRENNLFGAEDPFSTGGGIAYEVYDKVRGFSVEVFDGYEWQVAWESQMNLQFEAERQAEEEASGGTSNLQGVAAGAGVDPDSLAGTESDLATLQEQLEPPAAIPVAVRISVTFLAGDEKGAYVQDESTSGEFEEFTYTTIVRILTSMRVPLELEDNLESGDLGGLGGEGAGDGSNPGDIVVPGGQGGAGAFSGRGRGGAGRGGAPPRLPGGRGGGGRTAAPSGRGGGR